MARVSIHGGPKDGRFYEYPEKLPEMLSFQTWDGDTMRADNYRRKPHTRRYEYIEVGTVPGPVNL